MISLFEGFEPDPSLPLTTAIRTVESEKTKIRELPPRPVVVLSEWENGMTMKSLHL